MLKETPEENIATLIFLGSVLVVVFVAFIILLAILFTNKKNRLLQEKQLMKTQFEQELLQTQLEIQEQTLKTISQEIHDNVGQVLSLAKLNLSTFQPTENDYNQSRIDNTKQLVSKAINDLRDLSRSLHGDKITETGLNQSVINELKILQNTGQYETGFRLTGEAYRLEPQKEMVIFRMVQEAMNNAIKHAKAKHIVVEVSYKPGAFTLSIVDDGIGFDENLLKAQQTGIGLKSMQNRAAMIGGVLTIQSKEGEGSNITIQVKNIL